jgi:hypothetical protein
MWARLPGSNGSPARGGSSGEDRDPGSTRPMKRSTDPEAWSNGSPMVASCPPSVRLVMSSRPHAGLGRRGRPPHSARPSPSDARRHPRRACHLNTLRIVPAGPLAPQGAEPKNRSLPLGRDLVARLTLTRRPACPAPVLRAFGNGDVANRALIRDLDIPGIPALKSCRARQYGMADPALGTLTSGAGRQADAKGPPIRGGGMQGPTVTEPGPLSGR